MPDWALAVSPVARAVRQSVLQHLTFLHVRSLKLETNGNPQPSLRPPTLLEGGSVFSWSVTSSFNTSVR